MRGLFRASYNFEIQTSQPAISTTRKRMMNKMFEQDTNQATAPLDFLALFLIFLTLKIITVLNIASL